MQTKFLFSLIIELTGQIFLLMLHWVSLVEGDDCCTDTFCDIDGIIVIDLNK